MNKKLLAVAVAGALAAPGLALAQSSVTISGIFKVSMESHRIGSPTAARAAAGTSTSETRMADDSSRILFNVVEDLGGGLAAVGQIDIRFPIASGNFIQASGNTHVGLQSKTMGRVIFGRQDVHYFNTESSLAAGAGDLRADSVSVMSFIGGVPIASNSRTPNIIHYRSPNWGGFTVIGGYSTGAAGAATGQPTNTGAAAAAQQSDLASAVRKGSALVINPNFERSNWKVGYSYWNSKPDSGGATVATGDQRSSKLYGSFSVAGFKLGLAWDKSRIKSSTGATSGAELANRTAWSFPASYTWGNNQIHGHYSKARDDRATVIQDGGKMIALSYQYSLSKRTSVGLTYAKITNDVGATYQLFTTGSLGNSTGAAAGAGEDPRIVAGTIRHAF